MFGRVDLSMDFKQPMYKTVILTATGLITALLWAFVHFPEGNLLIAVLAALTAVRISAFASGYMRLRGVISITAGAAILQYVVSITYDLQLFNVLLPAAVGYIILRIMSGNSAHIVLLAGCLAYTALPGAAAGAERVVDIFFAGGTAWVAAMLACGAKTLDCSDDPGKPLPPAEAFKETLMLFCGLFLYKAFAIVQGIWITLTVIFICMLRQPGESNIKLVRQRIFSVPLGIMLGGIYSAAAVTADYRFAYFMPLIAAAGFFMLYYRHDFFLFSLFFMFAFTIYADWMSGNLHEFNFQQLLIARSLATVTGGAILLIFEKLATGCSNKQGRAA